MELLAAGDAHAWTRTMSLIDWRIRFWRLSTLEADMVRDHVQDVLLDDHMRRIRQLQNPGSFPAYVARIIRHKVVAVLAQRRNAMSGDSLDSANSGWERPVDVRFPAELSPLAAQESKVRDALCREVLRLRPALTSKQFRVLWLYHFERKSMNRIAAALKVSRRAVSKVMSSALAAIRRAR